jgi:ectoine hydroxylase-related dioxygenase (phytanoyl-CoA dioxygenase family)
LPDAPPTLDLTALREAFEKDGFVVVDLGLPEETLDRAIEDVRGEYREEGAVERTMRRLRRAAGGRAKTLSGRHPVRVQDAWTISAAVRDIALAPRIMDLLREFYGREPLPFQTINFRVGSQQAPHSDAWHFNSDPPGYMCGVSTALEDIDELRGPVVYYPGSHKLPEVTGADVERMQGDHGNDAYEHLIAEVIEREGLEPRQATIRKGEALVWASNLLHGGAPQLDPSLSRWSQVTHYLFEGCRWWQPMHAHGGSGGEWKPTFVS